MSSRTTASDPSRKPISEPEPQYHGPGKIAKTIVTGRIKNTKGIVFYFRYCQNSGVGHVPLVLGSSTVDMSKSEERQLFQRVLSIVNAYDFCGLEPGSVDGPPIDEYELEARPMESILVNRGHIETTDIKAIWLRWFGDDLSGHVHEVAMMADELNALVRSPAEGP